MARPKAPAWTSQERAILADIYPREGIQGAADALPDRSWQAIYVMASKLGLRSGVVPAAPYTKLQGERLERAIRMREADGWAFARIGAELGVSESAACNAVMIALCTRKGFRPAERDHNGRLLPEGRERLRYALRKGYKAIDISLRLGLSASRITEERRRYNAELKAAGKALLPPPGGGAAYSGVKLSKAKIAQVEALFLDGLGTQKIAEQTEVSHTSVVRIRARLVKRLARKGQCLPGCDARGNRHKQKDSVRFIPDEQKAALREMLLARMPVSRAAKLCGIGASAAYRIRDELKAELGDAMPTPKRPGRLTPSALRIRESEGIPADKLMHFRALVREHGATEARRLLAEERRAERSRPLTFEEQLERVRAGAALTTKFVPTKAAPEMTLGGVATGAL